MSNPADNSEGCEVCGLDRQVLGCRPGKCKNEKAPPLGYTKCPTPGCPRWMGPNRLKCWSEVLGGNSGVIYPDWEPPAPAAPEHPLPWRWERWEVGDDPKPEDPPIYWWALYDASNALVLSFPEEHCKPTAYVRAVTERAGAMEDGLRHLVNYIDHLRRVAAPGFLSLGLMVEHEAMRILLAEIDAAKAAG